MEKQLEIELVEAPDKDDSYNLPRGTFRVLAINGKPVDQEEASIHLSIIPTSNDKEPHYYTTHELNVKSDEIAEYILQCPLKALSAKLTKVTFDNDATYEDVEKPYLSSIILNDKESVFVFEFIVNVYDWNWPYTFSDYIESLRSNGVKHYPVCYVETDGVEGIGLKEGDERPVEGYSSVYISFPHTLGDEVGISVVETLKAICNTIYHETVQALSENKHSVEIVLDLPPDVRVSCEQYLLYFVQFLKDLGVEAGAELKHDAGQVLFSVTPVDKDEALDKIRAALEVYLCLPSGKLAVSGTDPVEIQRLSANVLHLQSQLMLRDAVIQAKDAAIQLQQVTIQRQQLLLAENVITQSVVDITPQKDEDREEFFGGAIALTKYEDKGVEINLAEIFRKLKRWFTE